ncbi:MAG TPA: hypothetical protein VIF09_07935 [Polyangiaceae bacterium]|jgi:hypothetical protein
MKGRRLVLACVVALDMALLAIRAHVDGTTRSGALGVLTSAPCLVLLALIGLSSLLAFARGRRTLVAGSIALAATASLESLAAAVSWGHQRAFFASGATLAGWLFGLAFARRAGEDEGAEALAEAGAIAGLAATYVDSGLSKLLGGGLAWTAGGVQTAILTNHPVDDTSFLAPYARFLVDHAGAAQALAALTLVAELGAFALVLGPRIRQAWAVLLVGFHVNVHLVAPNILYLQACVLLVAFSWPRDRSSAPALSPEKTRETARALGRWVLVAVAAAWLVREGSALRR